MRLHFRSLSSSTLIPVAPSALLNVICYYSLSTQGWERMCSFPKSNFIFNSQQIPMVGLLQAIVVLECSPRSSAPGPHNRSPYPTVPLREPLSERVGTTAPLWKGAAELLKLAQSPGKLVKNQIPGPSLGPSASAPPKEGSENLSF